MYERVWQSCDQVSQGLCAQFPQQPTALKESFTNQKSEWWARKYGEYYEKMCPCTNIVSVRCRTRSLVDMGIDRQSHRICLMPSSELAFQVCPWTEVLNYILCNMKVTGFVWERTEIISFSTGIIREMNELSILKKMKYKRLP